MRHTMILAALMLPFCSQAGELKLEFRGQDLGGQLLIIDLFDSEGSFLTEKHVRQVRERALAAGLTVSIPDLPVGRYAVAVFADRNQNGKLDKNFVGMPTELYGFSNDARGRFGPPGFGKASFHLGADAVVQTIHLQ